MPLREKGNLDPYNREITMNDDGTFSSMKTVGINDRGKEVIIPSFIEGKERSPMETLQHYYQTGEHFGKFDTSNEADAYDRDMHERMAADRKIKEMSGDPQAVSPLFKDIMDFLQSKKK